MKMPSIIARLRIRKFRFVLSSTRTPPAFASLVLGSQFSGSQLAREATRAPSIDRDLPSRRGRALAVLVLILVAAVGEYPFRIFGPSSGALVPATRLCLSGLVFRHVHGALDGYQSAQHVALRVALPASGGLLRRDLA